MTKNEYNGWFNYETWCVKLWMDNDSNYWFDRASEIVSEADKSDWLDEGADPLHDLACEFDDEIQSAHEENMPEVQGVFSDLLNAAMSEVNWYEIAKNTLEEAFQEALDELKEAKAKEESETEE